MSEGVKVFQAHLPVSLHSKLTKISKKLEISKSEIARQAIEAFLKTSLGNPNEQNRNS